MSLQMVPCLQEEVPTSLYGRSRVVIRVRIWVGIRVRVFCFGS